MIDLIDPFIHDHSFAILFISECKAIADVAFVIDSSGSIGRRNWQRAKEFLVDVVKQFKVSAEGTHVGIVMYSNKAEVVFKFNTLQGSQVSASEYEKLINNMRWQRGYTFIDRGIAKANEELFTAEGGMRNDVNKVRSLIVIYSEGLFI